MTYRLFYSPDSANLVIRMVLEELGVPFQGEQVDRAAALAEGIPGRLFIDPAYPVGDLSQIVG